MFCRNSRNQVLSSVILAALTAISSGVGCTGTTPTIFRVLPEAAGSNCEYGGLKIQYGGDANGDGKLSDNEVDPTQTQYACAVIHEGKTAKINITTLPTGNSHCANGGYQIQSGLDANSNGTLDTSEIESTAYICNGTDGTDGTNGTNGHNSLVRISALPSGAGGCQFGGTLVSSGVDTNDNGVLSDSEVQTSQAVCSVQVITNVIVQSSILNPNSSGSSTNVPNANGCLYGGVHLAVGVDLNGDKTLQPGEVTSTSDMCNQVLILNGKNSLIITSTASAAQCAFGGSVMQTGMDLNYNNILEQNEITNTMLVCTGANGYNSLVLQSPDNGTGCGARGGIKFQSGLDTNRNGSLDSGEVTQTGYICNGYTGADGIPSMIKQSADTVICGARGGVRIDTGPDTNRNSSLDNSEIQYTSYLCNGYDGSPAAIRATASPAGGFCDMGGVRYDSGPDLNHNGFLDNAEIQYTNYVCNGYDGWIVDVSNPASTDICANGGVEVLVGPDLNSDGLLTGSEVMQTTFICSP